MNIFTDGMIVLVNHAWTVFSIFIVIAWGQILITALFKKIFKDRLTSSEIISLGMAGWILPAALLSAMIFTGALLFGEIAVTAISAIAVIALIYVLFIGKYVGQALSLTFSGILSLVALVVSLLLQLAFLKNMLLPSYFDSAEHYRVIKYFSEYYVSSNGSIPLANYYHVGFHLLSVMVSHIFHLGIVDTMLAFGQVILTILPFSLFFIVKRETGSNMAAAFTCLLAGVGWHMPSHLMDWGKYPALFSLVGIQFVLSIGYWICKNASYLKNVILSGSEGSLLRPSETLSCTALNAVRCKRRSQRTLPQSDKSIRLTSYWLLSFGALVSALLHTRSLIVFAIMGISLQLTIWIRRLPLMFQRIAFVIVALFLAVEIVTVQNSAVLALLFETYVQQDIAATGLVFFLLIFSVWAFPDLTFFLLLLISLILAGLFIPVTGFMGYGTLTLLDRPYVQMLLYLPLSIFGGLGLAGLNQFLKKNSSLPKLVTQVAAFLLIAFIVLNAGENHSFYPSDCCQIVGHDDLSAIHWMDRTLPPDVSVLIASANLFVTSLESPETLAGVDGGIWIAPLISRKIVPMRGDVNFEQPEIHAEICAKNIGYIYSGGTSQSFNASQLDSRAAWYQVAFSLPAAKVYAVIGCG